jgi:hypothetical protein
VSGAPYHGRIEARTGSHRRGARDVTLAAP